MTERLRNKGFPHRFDTAEADRLHKEGLGPHAIAKAMGVNSNTMCTYIAKYHGRSGLPGQAFLMRKARDNPRVHPLIRQALATLRDDELVSTEKLAKRTGYAWVTIQTWLSGKRSPTAVALHNLLEALGVEVIVRRKGASHASEEDLQDFRSVRRDPRRVDRPAGVAVSR